MKRKIDIEEVRRFFETANRQFEEAGVFLHRVRIVRSEDPDTGAETAKIELNYEERPTEFSTTQTAPNNE